MMFALLCIEKKLIENTNEGSCYKTMTMIVTCFNLCPDDADRHLLQSQQLRRDDSANVLYNSMQSNRAMRKILKHLETHIS